MWSITVTGHNPENLNHVLYATVRGDKLRTLSTRCRALTGWHGYVQIEAISDDTVEIRPNKRSGQHGVARCVRGENPPKALPPGERVHAELRAYSLRDLIDHCRMRQAELKEKDAQGQTQTA